MILVPYLAGLIFGAGLVIAGMTQPGKVTAFLDVAGDWDPSLAFVMGGAIVVHFIAYRLVKKMPHPLLGGRWSIPSRTDIDWRLVSGAALFGAGWGLGGFCPGPAITSLPMASAEIFIFFGAMLAGMSLYQVVDRALFSAPAPKPASQGSATA